jgi:hypothetical protein
MNKFPKIPEIKEVPVEPEIEPEIESEEEEEIVQKPANEIFKMDQEEESSDEEHELPPPPIPIKKVEPVKKERSKKQLEHLEKIRVKAMESRKAKAKIKAAEKKIKEDDKIRIKKEKQELKEQKEKMRSERADLILKAPVPEQKISLNDIETIVDNALVKHTNLRKAELEEKHRLLKAEQDALDKKLLLRGLLKKPKVNYY